MVHQKYSYWKMSGPVNVLWQRIGVIVDWKYSAKCHKYYRNNCTDISELEKLQICYKKQFYFF